MARKKFKKVVVMIEGERLRLAQEIAKQEFGIEVGESVFLRTLVEKFIQEYFNWFNLDMEVSDEDRRRKKRKEKTLYDRVQKAESKKN